MEISVDVNHFLGKFFKMNSICAAGMSQWYFLFIYRNSFKERYTTDLSGLIAQDLSFSSQAQLIYNLSDYYSLTAKWTHNQGSKDTEFGNAAVSDTFEVTLDINF